MKKTVSFILTLAIILTLLPTALAAPASGTAYPSTQNVDVDGKAVEFQMYALKDENGNDTNYVKVRDVAHVLNGTAAQFSVGWDGAVNLVPGQGYTANGSEMSTPFSGQRTYTLAAAATNVNGQTASLEAIVLNDDNGGGYTYYKLRDLGTALGFTVDWSAEKGVFITTDPDTGISEGMSKKEARAALRQGRPDPSIFECYDSATYLPFDIPSITAVTGTVPKNIEDVKNVYIYNNYYDFEVDKFRRWLYEYDKAMVNRWLAAVEAAGYTVTPMPDVAGDVNIYVVSLYGVPLIRTASDAKYTHTTSVDVFFK